MNRFEFPSRKQGGSNIKIRGRLLDHKTRKTSLINYYN